MCSHRRSANAGGMATIVYAWRIVLCMKRLITPKSVVAWGLMLAGTPGLVWSQAAAAPQAAPTEAVRPLLVELNTAVSGLSISKWKAPGPVRSAAQENVGSIQRDITGTLPGLLDQANAAPESLGPAFAVYRNVDALYDVLLRLSGTADLAAPDNEALSLQTTLVNLSGARKQLGEAIMQTATDREAELTRLRAAATQAAAVQAQQAAPAKTVVDDGPAAAAPKKKKKKPAVPAAPAAPAANAPQ
jgi:hypothetical protein